MERSIVAEYPGPAKGPSETEQQILLPRRGGVPLKDRRESLNIAYQLNKTLCIANNPTHIRIHLLNYIEKNNLSSLMTPERTRSMLLPRD